MSSNYTKIFSGNSLLGNRIIAELKEAGIEAVVKNQGESARLAGFGNTMTGHVELEVHQDELERATAIVTACTEET